MVRKSQQPDEELNETKYKMAPVNFKMARLSIMQDYP